MGLGGWGGGWGAWGGVGGGGVPGGLAGWGVVGGGGGGGDPRGDGRAGGSWPGGWSRWTHATPYQPPEPGGGGSGRPRWVDGQPRKSISTGVRSGRSLRQCQGILRGGNGGGARPNRNE